MCQELITGTGLVYIVEISRFQGDEVEAGDTPREGLAVDLWNVDRFLAASGNNQTSLDSAASATSASMACTVLMWWVKPQHSQFTQESRSLDDTW